MYVELEHGERIESRIACRFVGCVLIEIQVALKESKNLHMAGRLFTSTKTCILLTTELVCTACNQYHQQDVSLDTFFLFSSTQLTYPHAACSSCSPSGLLPASSSPSQPAPKEASPPPAPAPAEPSSPIYTPEQRRAWREKMQKIWADEQPKSKPWVLSTSTASISIPSQELGRNVPGLRLLNRFK